ncbi:pentatricopeptide repeat-containing protein At1g26460, mitochondrial-like [Aristolochia californica]|uniref:pentatricopeptide repeat-containing protein At1g26460, mitochondrial-like n=1 Tax=Aristolochia californica TaxID=171875 RepID=UPI0035D8DA30
MATRMLILSKTHPLFKTLAQTSLNSLRHVSTFPFLTQEPQLEDPPPTPLPPNPSSGSPLYQENWRNPYATNPDLNSLLSQSLVPLGIAQPAAPSPRIQALSQTLDVESLMNVFADWMTSQRWADLKQLFEFWIRSLDKNGKPNKPDVNLYNHYLRANLMMGATAGELLDLVAQMEDYDFSPNTASYNLVLKAMYLADESGAAQKLLDRMLRTGKDSLPDDESYDLVIGLLFKTNDIDSALKYLDLTLKSGYMVSMRIFSDCVRTCVNAGRLDTLASIIERCKAMDQNKALCPSWNLCNYIADVALLADHSKLAFYALEFLARWIARGENAKPPVLLSLDEGLVVSAFGTAARTYDSKLVDASWAILQRSLRQKRVPIPESYLGKICSYASLGNLQRAFSTLHDFETAYRNLAEKDELFSPFTSLYPLVVACTKEGFTTLDSVYYQLENLSHTDPPYKSVAALNCVILGCANIWDIDRAYQTFEAISNTFGLAPNTHSYNALMKAFGRLKKTFEASRVFEHMTSLGVKPNAMSYSLLVDAHLANKDAKAALSVIDDMVQAGLTPSKETLKKVRRRCSRESDGDSDKRLQSLAGQFNYRMGGEKRREMLFQLEYRTDYP